MYFFPSHGRVIADGGLEAFAPAVGGETICHNVRNQPTGIAQGKIFWRESVAPAGGGFHAIARKKGL